jgi:hypothetical protein
MAIREYRGNAKRTAISGTITPTSITWSIDDPTGWPTGGVNGKFYATLDPDGATEETVLVTSRSAGTLTLAGTGDRGVDDTAAADHPAGTTIIHSASATDFREANAHVNNAALDDHTQYMLASGTRHDLTARHSAGTVVPTTTPGNLTTSQSAAEGTGVNLARATHVHGVTKGTPVAIGTVLAQGAAGTFADSAHVHVNGVGAINAANMFAADVVDTAAIGPLQVTSAELGALAVIAGKIAAAGVTAGNIAAGGVSATNQVADGILTLAKLFLEDPVSYAPTFANFSDGAGGAFTGGTGGTTYGYYFKAGRLVVFLAGFSMAADGNLPSGSTVRIPAPFTQRALGTMRGFVAARARRSTPEAYASGTGVIQAGNNFGENIATAGASAQWDATVPWNWGTPGDATNATLDAVGIMVSTT